MAIVPESLLSPGRHVVNLLGEGLRPLLAKRWLPPAVNLGALLILIAVVANGVWTLFKPGVPELDVSVDQVSGRAENFDLQPLMAAQLFGRSARGPALGGSLEGIPLSSLNLVLVGVVAPGYALISVDGRAQEAYAVGQEVTAGAVLRAVYADRVLIERAGVTESLMLQEAVKPLTGMSGFIAPLAVPYVPPVSAGVQELSKNQYQVAREQVNVQMRNPEFLTQARLLPHPSGGFLVREIKSGSIYEKLGLQVGDVVRALNGAPINSAEDAMKFYQQLGSLSQVRLEVMRGGRIEQLSYNLQ